MEIRNKGKIETVWLYVRTAIYRFIQIRLAYSLLRIIDSDKKVARLSWFFSCDSINKVSTHPLGGLKVSKKV